MLLLANEVLLVDQGLCLKEDKSEKIKWKSFGMPLVVLSSMTRQNQPISENFEYIAEFHQVFAFCVLTLDQNQQHF